MTTTSDLSPRTHRDLADFGFARVRDLAFEAVQTLWRRRQHAGLTQKDIAERLDRDQAWVSRNLSAPGNWTLRTFGELVQALDGEAEIVVHALEDPETHPANYDAYEDGPAWLAATSGSAFPEVILVAHHGALLPNTTSLSPAVRIVTIGGASKKRR